MSRIPFELTSQVIRAGAGAGKTTQLTNEVLRVAREFYAHEKRWPRLVVTTFTRKATQELRERLITKSVAACDWELVDFLMSRSQLQVSTMHGVLQSFLRRFGHLLGMDSGFQLLSSGRALRQKKAILYEMAGDEFKSLLSEVGMARWLPLLESYYAGQLLHPDLAPCQEADFRRHLQSHLEPLVQEGRSIIEALEESLSSADWLNFISEFKRWLERFANVDHQGDFAELSKTFPKKPRKSKKNPAPDEELADRWKTWDDQRKNYLERLGFQAHVWPKYFARFAEFESFAATFLSRWEEWKRQAGVLEMSDLELSTLKMITAEPELAADFSREWDYWLIDEYQDTSPLQVQLLKRLVGDRPSYVVGDPQQSIYLFRGARREVFEQKEHEHQLQGLKVTPLLTNYRSRPELLMFFNDFFRKLHPSFQLMEPREPPQETVGDRLIVARFYAVPRTEGKRGADEDQCLLHEILQLRSSDVAWDQICILARSHRYLAEAASFLRSNGVPVQVHAPSGFFQRREILDAMALLKFLIHPHDGPNLVLLLRSPYCRITDREMVSAFADLNDSHWQSLCLSYPDHPVIRELLELRDLAQTRGILQAFETGLRRSGFIDLARREDPSGRRESNLWKLVHKLRQVAQQPGLNLIEWIAQGDGVVDQESMSQEGDAIASLELNCVHLMTIHASKGLKFDHVLLIRAGESPAASNTGEGFDLYIDDQQRWSFPYPVLEGDKKEKNPCDARMIADRHARELEESDRLLYVALTRAARSVVVLGAEPARKESFFHRMRWDMTPGLHSMSDYRYEVINQPPEANTKIAAIADWLKPRPLWSGESSMVAKAGRYSVTELVNASGAEPTALSVTQWRRSAEGVLVHRLFEMLKTRSPTEVKTLANQWLTGRDLALALDFVIQLQHPPMMELIKNGHVEWGFHLKTQDGVMEGQIDLWGVVDKTLWLIDYKSGSPEGSERAFTQLTLYAQAVRPLHADLPIHLAAVFPLHQTVSVRVLE